MSSKMLLSALAAVAAVAVVASPPQDPSFEYPGAKYVGFDLPKQENTQSAFSAQSKQANDRVSVTFKNATVREVLDWLKDQGVSFVVKDEQVDKNARVSLNAVNQPLGDVMNALARSLNGHWAKSKDMWVFQPGATFFEMPAAGVDGTFSPGFQGQKMTKEQEEAFRKAMEGHSKDMEKWSQDFAKKMEGMKFEKLDPKAFEEVHKGMIELQKDGKTYHYQLKPGQNGFTWNGKEYKPLDEKQIKEMTQKALEMSKQSQKFWSDRDGVYKMDEKAMKEWQEKMKKLGQDRLFASPESGIFKMDEKAMKEWQQKMQKMGRDGVFMAPEGKIYKMDEKALKEWKEKMKKMGQDGVFVTPGQSFKFDQKFTPFFKDGQSSFKSHNLKGIYDSLTPAQTKILETRGFLRYSDLNSNQRAMLGSIGDDSWTISYKTDKVNITIKSDR